jgi:transcriptional regulator with XRE-family HTH domain
MGAEGGAGVGEAADAVTPFGLALRLARRQAGLSQQELAAAVGISATYVSKLEHGRTPPPAVPTLLALAAALATDPLPLLQARRPLPAALAALDTAQWEAVWEWLR